MSQMLIFANLWHTNLNLWKTCVQAESLHHNNNNDTTTPQEKKKKMEETYHASAITHFSHRGLH